LFGTFMRLCPLVFALALLVPPSAAASAQQAPLPAVEVLPSVTLPPELDRVLRDYERAWGAADAVALSMLFAEDGFVLQGGRAPVRGRVAIQRAYSSGAGGALRLRALAHGTDGALGYIIGTYGYGDDGADIGKYTLTLRRDANGQWLIFSDMDNTGAPARRAGTPASPAP